MLETLLQPYVVFAVSFLVTFIVIEILMHKK